MNYREAMDYIEELKPLGSVMGLENMRGLCERLGNPQDQLKFIHIAGTNGKGSVCADLTAVLVQAGYRTGTFISPHLEDIRERILLDGEMVSREGFQDAFDRVLAVVREKADQGFCHPTFFEFLFLMAMVVFDREPRPVSLPPSVWTIPGIWEIPSGKSPGRRQGSSSLGCR